jgi:hypothetical protein
VHEEIYEMGLLYTFFHYSWPAIWINEEMSQNSWFIFTQRRKTQRMVLTNTLRHSAVA